MHVPPESPRLKQIEAAITELTIGEQLILLERLAQRIREASLGLSRAEKDAAMAAMANDPDVQYELREINSQFAVAESDGLDEYQ
jgi:hypothetical protein